MYLIDIYIRRKNNELFIKSERKVYETVRNGWSCQGCQGLKVLKLSEYPVKGSSAFSLPGHLGITLCIADSL
jgi:hypothetical protein